MKGRIIIAAAAFGASAALLPASAVAQISDSWQFQGSIYGYLPTMTVKRAASERRYQRGQVRRRDDPLSPEDDVHGLARGAEGTLGRVHGRHLHGRRQRQREEPRLHVGRVQLPADVAASTSMDMKSVVWTLGGSYRAVASPDGTLDVLAGARLLDIKETLSLAAHRQRRADPASRARGQRGSQGQQLGRDHRGQGPACAGRRREVLRALLPRRGHR